MPPRNLSVTSTSPGIGGCGGVIPPPLPPREISDNMSIRSELLVAEPTVGISQPATPNRSKTVHRKAPPKSPSLKTEEEEKSHVMNSNSKFKPEVIYIYIFIKNVYISI